MGNGVPLTANGLSFLLAVKDFHDVAVIEVRVYADGREAEFEPGYIMRWSVNNHTLGGGLEIWTRIKGSV